MTTLYLSAAAKPLALLAFVLVCASIRWLIARYMPEGWLKRQLERRYTLPWQQ